MKGNKHIIVVANAVFFRPDCYREGSETSENEVFWGSPPQARKILGYFEGLGEKLITLPPLVNRRSETRGGKVIIDLRRRRNFQYFWCFLGFSQCFGSVLRLFSTRKWWFGAWISEKIRLRRANHFNSTMVEAPPVIRELYFRCRSRVVFQSTNSSMIQAHAIIGKFHFSSVEAALYLKIYILQW